MPALTGTGRITIRLDQDILDWFRHAVESTGEGNYQTVMNDALRAYIEGKTPSFEQPLRRVVREGLAAARR